MRGIMRTRASSAFTLFVAVVVSILCAPVIASAHGGDDDPNHVHACIGNVSKVVRIVGVNGTCIAAPPIVAETATRASFSGCGRCEAERGDETTRSARYSL